MLVMITFFSIPIPYDSSLWFVMYIQRFEPVLIRKNNSHEDWKLKKLITDLMYICWQSLVAVVIITAAMEEVRRKIQTNGPYRNEAQDFHWRDCCISPVWYQKLTVGYLNGHVVTYIERHSQSLNQSFKVWRCVEKVCCKRFNDCNRFVLSSMLLNY